ncbi:unnamed protein product [Vitrella brassicaformis CCMP3155]|uniref:Uncharacterized protein n=2 Tax=Vitrella brassicaformis TaxID=1169539 RepID=A0A0G4ESL3_VITBC|nr:unnamed protein product [Vitrella brassicaformis CCMP3155]|mmetsp:Transcript_25445/g.73496  ORF Transcript_25445/g.73496 Transcript_25445/m.73496 type:complete len:278 (-) Transcript_25445:151-984(-)|eukprot:CEM00676.1 unnamed protein product [Vitrella brassicaformis CCMP3155]
MDRYVSVLGDGCAYHYVLGDVRVPGRSVHDLGYIGSDCGEAFAGGSGLRHLPAVLRCYGVIDAEVDDICNELDPPASSPQEMANPDDHWLPDEHRPPPPPRRSPPPHDPAAAGQLGLVAMHTHAQQRLDEVVAHTCVVEGTQEGRREGEVCRNLSIAAVDTDELIIRTCYSRPAEQRSLNLYAPATPAAVDSLVKQGVDVRNEQADELSHNRPRLKLTAELLAAAPYVKPSRPVDRLVRQRTGGGEGLQLGTRHASCPAHPGSAPGLRQWGSSGCRG